MRKSGGIIALIAGIFGTGAAFVTLFFGAVAGGLESIEGVDDTGAGDMILAMGWIGVFWTTSRQFICFSCRKWK